mmetsp:Transcript_118195/g.185672  ORF Transcript_118195/g.185672 Transcript_118195/m.185672 type:complete len:86 (+) Transcript_118195:533-790(+)
MARLDIHGCYVRDCADWDEEEHFQASCESLAVMESSYATAGFQLYGYVAQHPSLDSGMDCLETAVYDSHSSKLANCSYLRSANSN